MTQIIRKYLTLNKYRHRIKKINRYFKTVFLQRRNIQIFNFTQVWDLPSIEKHQFIQADFKINVFGIEIDPDIIDWSKDYIADFKFPLIRIDKIKPSKYYNKGIDIKFPWELSRFSFAHDLAVRFRNSNDIRYYQLYRKLVLDWIIKNPFLFGVNWLCTMDVAIRATNWIISASVFYEQIKEDKAFYGLFSKSLVEHASYILTFPEIYEGGHTTNHTTSDYVGLLYLSLALPDHPDARKWQLSATRGILKCMEYQTYNDGGSFEASIGYHRLVTELFGLSAVLCRYNHIELPKEFFEKLDNMFTVVSSIIDKNGNVPIYGDNDSGTLMQFDYDKNNDYSYLFNLRSLIFCGNSFLKESEALKSFMLLLPCLEIQEEHSLNFKKLKDQELKHFKESGIDVLRINELICTIFTLPTGQNGHGGHNHYDAGSFTVSFNGIPIIVDPGMYSYTRNLAKRNKYRSYFNHNTVIPEGVSDSDFSFKRLFITEPYYKLISKLCHDENNSLELTIQLNKTDCTISRSFSLETNTIKLVDKVDGNFTSQLFLSPYVEIIDINKEIIQTNYFSIHCSGCEEIFVDNYEYSCKYNFLQMSKVIQIKARASIALILTLNDHIWS